LIPTEKKATASNKVHTLLRAIFPTVAFCKPKKTVQKPFCLIYYRSAILKEQFILHAAK
jgi:hypothetical protein